MKRKQCGRTMELIVLEQYFIKNEIEKLEVECLCSINSRDISQNTLRILKLKRELQEMLDLEIYTSGITTLYDD
ncbi:hypothetical protein [Shewanella halifaxensis]|uniref:hypothetical protein n=1 Tax=Shewanella halifaxensis TaxID=271098 RepID=UPI00059E4F60|nr:hypothetical protein [Shewanella halifaxensis]